MLGGSKMAYPFLQAPTTPTGGVTGGQGGGNPVIVPNAISASLPLWASTYIKIAWTYVGGTYNPASRTYNVYKSVNGGASSIIHTQYTNLNYGDYTDTNVVPGNTYTYYVASPEASAQSAPTSLTLVGDVPSAPATAWATSSYGQNIYGVVNVNWTEPSSTGGLPITNYEIAFNSVATVPVSLAPGINDITVAGTTRSYAWPGIPSSNGGNIYFFVRAWNSRGAGPWSTAAAVRVYGYSEQTITQSTTYAKPANAVALNITIIGGGGGGGNSGVACGGGGAGEIWNVDRWDPGAGTSWAVVVGNGGNAGSSGGDSSFGGFVAKGGGAGGIGDSAGSTGGNGGGGSQLNWAISPYLGGAKTGVGYGNAGGNSWEGRDGPTPTIVCGGGGGGSGGQAGTSSTTPGTFTGVRPSYGGFSTTGLGFSGVCAGGGGGVFLFGVSTNTFGYDGYSGNGASSTYGRGAIINEGGSLIRPSTPGINYGDGGGGGAQYGYVVDNGSAGKAGAVKVGYYY